MATDPQLDSPSVGRAATIAGRLEETHPEPYVDATAGAAFLGIHAKTLMRLAREGRLPAYAISEGMRRHWRFLISELDTWMKAQVNLPSHPVRPCPANGRRKK